MVRPALSRRATLTLIAVLTAAPALAAPADPAANFIRDLQAQFARAAPAGKRGDAAAVERIIVRAFDMDALARAALGSRAVEANAAQIRRLGRVFVKRVTRETLERRAKARGNGTITGSKPAGPGQWLVTTRGEQAGNDPVILAWKVRQGPGGLKIVDVLRDGSSLVNSERRNIQLALRTRSLDAVIAEMEQKYAKPAA
jgi:ABC-type transporter MlaC component